MDKDKQDQDKDSPDGRRSFLRSVRNYGVKLAALGTGLAAYNAGRAGRADDIREDLPGELTVRNKQKISDMLTERSDDAGSKIRLTGGIAAGSAAAAIAAAVKDGQEVSREDSEGKGKRNVSRREFFGRSAEIAGGAAIAAGVGGVLHAAGGGRELNEITQQLPETLSPPERTAVEKVVYKAGDANERRVDTSENVLTAGVAGFLGGHLLRVSARRSRDGDEGPER